MLIKEGVWIWIFQTDKKALRHKFPSVHCLHSAKAHVEVVKIVYCIEYGYINKAEKFLTNIPKDVYLREQWAHYC